MPEKFPSPGDENEEGLSEEEKKQRAVFEKEGIPSGIREEDREKLEAPNSDWRRTFDKNSFEPLNENYTARYEEGVGLQRLDNILRDLDLTFTDPEARDFYVQEFDRVLKGLKQKNFSLDAIQDQWKNFKKLYNEDPESEEAEIAFDQLGLVLEGRLTHFQMNHEHARARVLARELGHPSEWLDQEKYKLEVVYNQLIGAMEQYQKDLISLTIELGNLKLFQFVRKKEIKNAIEQIQNHKTVVEHNLQSVKFNLRRKGIEIPPPGERFDPPTG